MIEGIIGLFVILILLIVVPYIKDFFREKTVTSIKVFPSEPDLPLNGDLFYSTDDGKTRVWKDNQWVLFDGPPKNPQAGDVWFW